HTVAGAPARRKRSAAEARSNLASRCRAHRDCPRVLALSCKYHGADALRGRPPRRQGQVERGGRLMRALPLRQLAVALAPRDTAHARELMERAASVADLVELRLDLMNSFDMRLLLRDRPCPVVITCRPTREGGRFGGDEASRIGILRDAISLGADFVDV